MITKEKLHKIIDANDPEELERDCSHYYIDEIALKPETAECIQLILEEYCMGNISKGTMLSITNTGVYMKWLDDVEVDIDW